MKEHGFFHGFGFLLKISIEYFIPDFMVCKQYFKFSYCANYYIFLRNYFINYKLEYIVMGFI